MQRFSPLGIYSPIWKDRSVNASVLLYFRENLRNLHYTSIAIAVDSELMWAKLQPQKGTYIAIILCVYFTGPYFKP